MLLALESCLVDAREVNHPLVIVATLVEQVTATEVLALGRSHCLLALLVSALSYG
jgi:hypothetical protein